MVVVSETGQATMIYLGTVATNMIVTVTIGDVSCWGLPGSISPEEFGSIIWQHGTKSVEGCGCPQKCCRKSLGDGGSRSIVTGDRVAREAVDPTTIEGYSGIWG